MAYDKQTWETGQTITALKLNHMEDGIANSGGGGGGLFVHATEANGEVTVEEDVDVIVDAIKAEQNITMVLEDSNHNVSYLALDCYMDAQYGGGTPLIDFKTIADVTSNNGRIFNINQKYVSYDGDNNWYFENRQFVINGN